MKTPAKENEKKRLQRNIARRERLANLSNEENAIILEQRNPAYKDKISDSAFSDNTRAEEKRLERNAAKRKWYAELPKDRKYAILKKKKEAYAERKLKAKFNPPPLQIIRESPTQPTECSDNLLDKALMTLQKNKETQTQSTDNNTNSVDENRRRASCCSSYEIGSSSSHPFEMAQPVTNCQLLSEDFLLPLMSKDNNVTTTSCTLAKNLPVATQNQGATTSTGRNILGKRTTRPRTEPRKGFKKTTAELLQNIAADADFLPVVRPCKYCEAKRFYRESNGFCCSDGEVVLISNDILDELYDLYTSQTEDASHFRTYARTYNNTFTFTSFGVKYDRNLCQRNKGIYTFKVQGQVYHYINEIIASTNPSYLQLYFYDTEHELYNRMKSSTILKANIAEKLIHILTVNPYANFFRSLTSTSDLITHDIILKANPDLDQRIYNCPTSSQVAAIWQEDLQSSERKALDIIVYNHVGYSHKVQYYYGCYDPLQYPLLFPYGQSGWHQGIERANRKGETPCAGQLLINPYTTSSAKEILRQEEKIFACATKKRCGVSCREYYCYKLQIRPDDKSALLQAGRLLQQYIVDMYVKLETSRLDYFRNNQHEIRSEAYQGLLDSIALGETRASKVGKRIVLHASFTGGPRDMRNRYIDAMTLVQKFGKPDILLTMTCNPNWSEIKQELKPGEEPQNRADLIARVFRAKLQILKDELMKKEIFGPIAAYSYVIEYQKRGLPHAHFLLIFKPNAKLLSPASYDKIVSAELPDKDLYPHLYAMVVKHMMHGPCGSKNPDNICMHTGRCKNHYPKQFSLTTTQGDDSYPVYRRRNDGKEVKVRGSVLNNQWVIPYNPYLLAKFNCHINVEICSSIKAVKYLYKYIYKGHDQITFLVGQEEGNNLIDEIQQFQTARWVSAAEAMWRIYGFLMNEMHPAVQSLQLHLKGKQLVSFTKYDKLENIVKYDRSSATMLTEYFDFYLNHPDEPKYLYKQFPEHFVWDQQKKIWTKRRRNYVIGRIITANPIEGERYYLRLLLNHIKGPRSYDDLLTINDYTAASFRESALLYGLLESDNNLEECLHEATSFQMPDTLRRLFSTILVHCSPNDPEKLWETFESAMSEDFKKRNISNYNNNIQIQVLMNINSKLQSMGKTIKEYKLIDDNNLMPTEAKLTKELKDELRIETNDEDLDIVCTLNSQQKYAFDTIIERVFSGQPGAFFIDGPGGTGKTYLYRALLASVRCRGHIALATATSGVAASILPGGRTAHSRFKIPINIDESSTCNISKQTGLAQLIRAAKMIIWDEASMAKRQMIEAFNKMLQDVGDCTLPFGGKVVVFGGDFRQVLPVVPKATREETIDASLVMSNLWTLLEKIRLTENMRARFDTSFTDFLLRVGNDTEQEVFQDKISIPSHMVVPYSDDNEAMNLLASHVFPNLHEYANNPELMTDRAILTPTNDFVDDINNLLIDNFPGEVTEYRSFDKTLDTSLQGQHGDFINTLTPKGLPPHILKLKPNCPVILLRNIYPPEGLSNGTRLICREFSANMIYVEISVGSHRGKKVFLPRIPIQSEDSQKYPVPFQRKQFPIRVCFAMTINKAQGQTLEFVGLYLPRPVFSHGQLYVALSRARTSNAIKIMIRPTEEEFFSQSCTDNIVYRELLASADK